MQIKNDFVKIEIIKNGKVQVIEKRNFLTDLYIKRYKENIMQKKLGIMKPRAEMNKIFLATSAQTVTKASTSITGIGGVIDSQFVFGAQLDSDILYNENFLTITHRYTQTLDGSYYTLFGQALFGVGFGDVAYYDTNDYLYAWLQLSEFNIIIEEGMTINFVRQDTYTHGGISDELTPYHLSQYGIDGYFGYLDSISLGYDAPEVLMANTVISNTITDEISFTGDLFLNSGGANPFYPSEDLYPSDDLYPQDLRYTDLFQKYRIFNGTVDTGLFYYIKNQIKDLDTTFDNERVSLKIKYERGA